MRPSRSRTRRLRVDGRYLVFPRRRDLPGEGADTIAVQIDGENWTSVHEASLAASDPDFYSFLDLRGMAGSEATVTLEGPNADGIDLVRVADEIPSAWPLYREPGRPQLHFSPLRGWLNDPSGMIYLDGRWHLYYANTRFANRMAGPDNAWAHAVSTDLVHWEELPLFLLPVRGECSFWTGGAAVDVENTTGLGRPGAPAVVFSANNGSDAPNAFTQCVFVSTDGGASCMRDLAMMYKPLPPEDARRGGGTRDPMILWWAPERVWVMIVYNHPPGGERSFHFFRSRDLASWTETSVLPGMFECPNLVELPVDGDPGRRRWVIWGSSTEYRIGSFDGSAFTPDHPGLLRTHHGAFSASQVFANAPGGRTVQIGWAHCCGYDGEFSQMASFPLELSLRSTPEGPRLHAELAAELRTLRAGELVDRELALDRGTSLTFGDTSLPMEVIVEFEPGEAEAVELAGADLEVRWTAARGTLRVQGTTLPLPRARGAIHLHLLLDTPSVEVVADHGRCYVIEPRDWRRLMPGSPLAIRAVGGALRIRRLEAYALRPVHEPGR